MKNIISDAPRWVVWLSALWKVRDMTDTEVSILRELVAGRWRT